MDISPLPRESQSGVEPHSKVTDPSFGGPRGTQARFRAQAAAAADATVKADAAHAASTAGSSKNANAVSTLDTPFADPDTEALRQKLNEMLLAMRRS